MTAKTIAMIAAGLSAGISFHAVAEALNVKPGAWHITVVTTTTGNPIPPDALAKLQPDQRAKIEESMKARAGKPNTETFKSCITREDLDQDRMFNAESDGNCTRKILSKTATKLVIEQTCTTPQALTGRTTLEAKSPEAIVAVIDTVQGGANGKIHVDLKGRWLGAGCDGLE
jgi:Protein of unknown function (DUF3617)